MKLSMGKLAGLLLSVGVCLALGWLILEHTWLMWHQHEMLLTRRRVFRRLITWSANRTEFFLRCAFMFSLGAAFFSFGAIGLAGLIGRVAALGRDWLQGPYQSPRLYRLFWVPLGFFIVWLVLMFFLVMAYP